MKKLLLAMIPFLFAATCNKLPDSLFCADFPDEGHCRRFRSKKLETYDNDKKLYTSKVTKKTYKWSDVPKVCQPVDEFKTLKTFMDNHCHQNPSACGDEVGQWNSVGDELLNKLKGR